MESVKVHIFNAEGEAIEAINTINVGEGFPTEDGLTLTYTQYRYIETVGYLIIADDVTRKYLHTDVDVDVDLFLQPQP